MERNSGRPMYESIASEMREEIIRGIRTPGELLPSENLLRQRFEASRETVRKSLKILENENYIYSCPGKGYFVSKPKYNSFSLKIRENSQDTILKHISVVSAPAAVREMLELKEKQKVIEIIRVTYAEENVTACEFRYLPYDPGKPTIEHEIDYAVFPEVAANQTSAFAFHTRMQITAEAADDKVSVYLECDPGTPVLAVHRHLIGSNNEKLGYAIRYLSSRYGGLIATSGME